MERLAVTIRDKGETLDRVRILVVIDPPSGQNPKDRDRKTCAEAEADPWVVGREHSSKSGETIRPDFHFSTRLVSREHAHIWFQGKWTLLNVSQSNPINVIRDGTNIRLCSAKERGQQLLELEDDDVLQFAGDPFSLKVSTVIDETEQQVDDLPTEGGIEPRSHIPQGANLVHQEPEKETPQTLWAFLTRVCEVIWDGPFPMSRTWMLAWYRTLLLASMGLFVAIYAPQLIQLLIAIFGGG